MSERRVTAYYCIFDPDYHRDFNLSRKLGDDSHCRNEAEPGVGLCTPCLFGCAP